jgi:predicted alpha-1,2-mannosidase
MHPIFIDVRGLPLRLSAMRGVVVGLSAILLVAPGSVARAASPASPASLVNPFVGTGGDAGHTFPGAVVPSGMVQFSPVSAATASPGGYRYDDHTLRGFALTRLSGAGCANLGDLPIMPLTRPFGRISPPADVPPAAFRHRNETASAGRYAVTLDDGIRVALTATLRTGAATFAFPDSDAAYLALDAGGGGTAARRISLRVVGRTRVDGSVTSSGFCDGPAAPTVSFSLLFDQPIRGVSSWGDDGVVRGGIGVRAATSEGGLLLRFAARVVKLKAGVSYVDAADAALNRTREIAGWDFDAVAAAARGAWDELLSRVTVTGASPSTRRTFYTALYHALIHPTIASDVNGEYRRRDGTVGRAFGYRRLTNISGWDVYRTQVPLLSLVEPRVASDLVRSMLAGAAESGTLAKWEYAGLEGGIMVGDPAAPIIAGAHAFGARGFDLGAALSAVEASGRNAAPGPFVYPSNLASTDGSPFGAFVDRPGLADYLTYGYVPYDETAGFVWGPAATTLEYATADFAVSRLALAAGDDAVAAEFLARSSWWRRLFNPVSGYLEPRNADGSFLPRYSPSSKIGFVEGNATQYTWMVPFDVDGLVRALGPARAASRLDSFLSVLNTNRYSPHAWLGNEPSFGSPWLYLWLGKPARTQAIVRRALTTLFHPWPAGLPGDDDLGAVSSWYVWSSLGLYPAIPGVGGVVLSSPLFRSATIRAGGRTISIETSGDGTYVRSLTVGGRRHDRTWLSLAGAKSLRLRYALARRPQAWGATVAAGPPSFEPRR